MTETRTSRMAILFLLAGLVLPLVITGCATLPQQVERTPSQALTDTADTRIGQALAPLLPRHPNLSGFHPLSTGIDALVARVGLIYAAQRSLDVQYYIWHNDSSGLVLLESLLRAADRGVRVRLLLDDLDTAGKDQNMRIIDQHPNIEIRLFNPFANRERRVFDVVTDFSRINRRMHNKSLTADALVTIVGGRNVGNEYFGGESHAEFSDLDVLAVGPVVREVEDAFDLYWNSDWAVPLTAFPGEPVTPDDLIRMRQQLQEFLAEAEKTPYARALRQSDLAQSGGLGENNFVWGRSILLYDSPQKAAGIETSAATHIGPRLAMLLGQVQHDLIIISPYFVPGDQLVAALGKMVQRGVKVRILTNSLAANDVSVVHAGYMRYREDLIRAGVELYEFKPHQTADGRQKKSWKGSSRASLHAKTFAGDKRFVFVGSFNLDPRSVELNTEMGVVFESPELAGKMSEVFEQDLLDHAYRLDLDEDGDLNWTTGENGRKIRFDQEPETGWWQRLSTRVMSVFVIESML